MAAPDHDLAGARHLGWHQPRHLPHYDHELVSQMITYRLADALPRSVSRRGIDDQEAEDSAYCHRIEEALDAGHGSRCLGRPAIAQLVIDAWRAFDGERYGLVAWVVMPTHVHVLVTLGRGYPLAGIVQSWKSWTGRRIRTQLSAADAWPSSRPIWQRDYWDRFVRDERHFAAAVDWPWSSAHRGSLNPGQIP